MDWKTLFLNAQGRIGQRDFWLAIAALFLVNLIVSNLGPLGFLGLLLMYPAVCVYAKRLHDFGKSGWLMLIPIGALVVVFIVAAIAGGAAVLGLASGSDAAAGAGALIGGGLALVAMLGAAIVSIGFVIWVGTRPSDVGDNLYGPPPTKLITAF